MNDMPFGFSNGDSDDKDDRSGGGGNPFGFGAGAFGQAGQGGAPGPGGFDPNNLGAMFAQLGEMISGMGTAMNNAAANPGGDPVNYEVAANLARQQIGKHSPVSEGERTAVNEAVHLAQIWLDESTVLPASSGTVAAWTPVDWLEKTLPTWKLLCNPVAKQISGAISAPGLGSIPEEAQGFLAPMMGMMSQLGSVTFGSQLGQALGTLASEVLTSTDIGVPLAPEGTLALLPSAIAEFTKGLEQQPQEVLVFLAAREAAHQRLFSHVPWLRQRLLATIEEYAQGISLEFSALDDLGANIDPELLTDPAKLQELLGQQQAALAPKQTPGQTAALERLETLLALIEGWVETIVHQSISDRLPGAAALRETMRRRRGTGGPAEQTFATLVGLELRPRAAREAATLWDRVLGVSDISTRDGLWGHPDLLPDANDLTNPAGFIDRFLAPDLGDPIAELERTLAAEADESGDHGAARDQGPDDDEPGDPKQA